VKPYTGGIRHDYKDISIASPARLRRRWSWFIVGLSVPLLGVSLLLVSEANQPTTSPDRSDSRSVPTAARSTEPAEAAREAPAVIADGPIELPLALPPHPSTVAETGASPTAAAIGPTAAAIGPTAAAIDPTAAAIDPAAAMLDLIVQKGDTLDRLFRRNGLSLSDLAAMVGLPEAAPDLKRLRPGDRIEIAHKQGAVLSLSREIDETRLLSIERRETGFEATTLSRDVEIRTNGTHGVIERSLFEAGSGAGISDAITMEMAGIFQWDIDFIQDVRLGDQFTVVYEELWRDGNKLRNGAIVAAEFVNQGKTYRAARYTGADGRSDYFTPQGRSVRKAFIRAPVDFTRISSNFNPNRRHPVLNTIRAHRGVDYAAPSGTPIRAAGDGKVTFRGAQGGYGNTVILQHGGNITTLYGHLSKFAKPRVGSRVKQGEIIGYVGKSGLATGPHLHYEYRIRGVHRNPRTVPLPPADPVAPEYRRDFEATTAALWRQLDLFHLTRLAAATE
jgi:murein DD-endopeptidase MepM/ murein hydrolase activator NlpD